MFASSIGLGLGRWGGYGGYPRGYLAAGLGYPYQGFYGYPGWGCGYPGYGCYGGYGGYPYPLYG
jgi:hypothetical protein